MRRPASTAALAWAVLAASLAPSSPARAEPRLEAGGAFDFLLPLSKGGNARAVRFAVDFGARVHPQIVVGGTGAIVAADNNDGDCRFAGRCFHRHAALGGFAEGRLLREGVVVPWARASIGGALLLEPYGGEITTAALVTTLTTGIDVRVGIVSFGPQIGLSGWSGENPETVDLGLRGRLAW